MNPLFYCVIYFMINISKQSVLLNRNENKTISGGDLSIMNSIGYCMVQSNNILECLKNQAMDSINLAINDNESWQLNDFITLNKNPEWSLNKIDKDNNNNNNNKTSNISIFNKLSDLIQSRSLQLTFSKSALTEGRKGGKGGGGGGGGKGGKGGMFMLTGLALAAMAAQLAIGKIAFLAGAALLLAKIALLFSVLSNFKRYMTPASGSEHVVYQEHGGHGGHSAGYGNNGWQRSIHQLAPDYLYHDNQLVDDGV